MKKPKNPLRRIGKYGQSYWQSAKGAAFMAIRGKYPYLDLIAQLVGIPISVRKRWVGLKGI